MRTDTVVGDTAASQLAWASARYRIVRPAFWIPVVVELALAGVFLAAGHPAWAVLLVLVALLAPAGLLVQTPSLAAGMARRGYRPGTVLTVDWGEDDFTISTPDGSGTHLYRSVTGARQLGSAVVLRIRGARVLLLLPADVVPEEARPRLGLTARP